MQQASGEFESAMASDATSPAADPTIMKLHEQGIKLAKSFASCRRSGESPKQSEPHGEFEGAGKSEGRVDPLFAQFVRRHNQGRLPAHSGRKVCAEARVAMSNAW